MFEKAKLDLFLNSINYRAECVPEQPK